MKLFFLETDTLFKIFKTIEKVPKGKTLSIFIEAGNDFFHNERRAKQIQELLERKNLNAVFITKDNKCKKYYEKVSLTFEYQGTNKWIEALNASHLFLFNIKKFHKSVYQKRHYISYIIFGAEVLIIGVILYMLYALIVPSSTLIITPNYEVEDVIYNFRYYPDTEVESILEDDKLSIPYQRGEMEYTHQLTTNVANITSNQKPAQGSVTLYNETSQGYEIVSNTQFITNGGMVFRSTQSFTIPAGSPEQPGTTEVTLRADDLDIFDNIIGARGNIPPETLMYIRNLNESYFLKRIYALSSEEFKGGETDSRGSISNEDVQFLEQKLTDYIRDYKENIVRQSFDQPDSIVLPFKDLIEYTIQEISTNDKIGDIQTDISGEVIATLRVPFVKEKDLIEAIMHFLQQRKTNTQKLADIDTKSVIFYEIRDQDENLLTIPTSVSVIFGYDFDNDTNSIKESIKNDISGESVQYARNILLSHPEIAAAEISIKPPWYNQIPTTKSRIIFKVK